MLIEDTMRLAAGFDCRLCRLGNIYLHLDSIFAS